MMIAHIKAIFIILLFLLLLIIPGLYKMIRLSFYSETVLFDKKDQGGFFLKKAQHNAQDYFWPLTFLAILDFLSFFLIPLITKFFSFEGIVLQMSQLIIGFYFSCFLILWYSLFFFEVKKKKGEEISC